MPRDKAGISEKLGVSTIPKTTNNKVIDASSSLLCFVSTLPEYSCKPVKAGAVLATFSNNANSADAEKRRG